MQFAAGTIQGLLTLFSCFSCGCEPPHSVPDWPTCSRESAEAGNAPSTLQPAFDPQEGKWHSHARAPPPIHTWHTRAASQSRPVRETLLVAYKARGKCGLSLVLVLTGCHGIRTRGGGEGSSARPGGRQSEPEGCAGWAMAAGGVQLPLALGSPHKPLASAPSPAQALLLADLAIRLGGPQLLCQPHGCLGLLSPVFPSMNVEPTEIMREAHFNAMEGIVLLLKQQIELIESAV